jgi:Gp157 protein
MTRVQPELVRRAVEALLLEYPELKDDEELRTTAIEGETDTFEPLADLLSNIRECQTIGAAIGQRIEALRLRLSRFEQREEFHRKLAHRVMEAAGLRKVVLPEATLSIRPVPPAVRIIHPDFIPEEFWRVKREPNVSQIKTALKAGHNVPGASLSNAGDTLAIITR